MGTVEGKVLLGLPFSLRTLYSAIVTDIIYKNFKKEKTHVIIFFR